MSRGASACGFAVVLAFAGHDGMASRLLSPDCCLLVRAGGAGPGPGRRPGRPVAAPQASLTRRPTSRQWAGQGKARQAPGGLWSYARPIAGWSGVAGPLAAVIPSGVPRPGGPGGMGRSASGPGGVNHNRVRAAAPVTRCRCGRGTDNEAAARPAGPAAHAAGLAARRTRPSRMA